MADNIKVTIVVPSRLQADLRERVIKDGYGFRGKSKWISEAIKTLLSLPNFPELVSYNDEMQSLDKVETLVIDYSLRTDLETATMAIRKVYPMLEGVKSRIIRTAIIQRLLRSGTRT